MAEVVADGEGGLRMQVVVELLDGEATDGEMSEAHLDGEMVIVLTAGAGTEGWKRLY